jgi:hypothetical protein
MVARILTVLEAPPASSSPTQLTSLPVTVQPKVFVETFVRPAGTASVNTNPLEAVVLWFVTTSSN